MGQVEPQSVNDHGGLDLPFSLDNDRKLLAALQALCTYNEQVVKECHDASHEAVRVANSQLKARVAGFQGIANTFRPEVLRVLKRSADQLVELKKQHLAEKQASREVARRLMSWANKNQQSKTAESHNIEMQQDAVKHGRFKFLQLPGSKVVAPNASSSAAPTSAALKYWQIGIPASAGLPRSLSCAAGNTDQQQLQKSLSSRLFGKNRRVSTSSAGTAAASPARMSDAAASWRSSDNGAASNRSSQRFSETGRSGTIAGQAARSAAPGEQALLASLTAGEGPLSKSHSLLAKPGSQVEQLRGNALEIVAEDEREGHDSPQPDAEPRRNTNRQQSLVSTVRAQLAGGGRTQSPIESFSFGKRPDEESRSPDFLRASVGSRQNSAAPSTGTTRAVGASAGPLVRLSGALQSSRVDPFDAPEPQPQPFIEQMKLEDQAMQAGQMTSSSGVLGALRRSLSMPARAVGMLQPSKSRSIRTPLLESGGVGPLAASAGAAVQQNMVLQQQRTLQQRPAASIGDDFEMPTAGDDVELLDLDASRAYAMGIHQMMQGMADALDGSEDDSKPHTPRSAELNEQLSNENLGEAVHPADVPAAVAPVTVMREQSEIQPADDDLDTVEEPSLRPGLEQQLQQQLEQHRLEQQHSQRQLFLPGPALSPEASRQASALPNQPHSAVQPTAAAQDRFMRPSSSSAASRRPSHSAGAAALVSAPSATRGLPMMGQASMDILGRPPPSLVQPERRPMSSSSSANMRLTEVYQQTAGTLNPLSSGLSTMKRRSSHGARPQRRPSMPSPRSSTQDDTQSGYAPAAGPLMAQRSSSMLNPRKPPPAVTASPRETRTWGWQSLGLPTGPAGPPADSTMGPSTYGGTNKYAASWGLMDAASTAAATTAAGGPLSRQASATGGLSRQQSAVMQGQLSRQNSAMSMKSPRSPFAQQQQMQQQLSARQQWQQGGAAGRYAGPASATPTSQSPRSDLGTPVYGNQQVAGGAAAAARAKQAAAAAALQSRRLSDPGGQDSDEEYVDDDGYDTAEEASASSSSYAGSTGVGKTPPSVSTGAQQKLVADTRVSPVPNPPAFLTSAQAAVAAQWSPNKHASAMAQAPAYARDALVAEVSDVIIDEGQGLQPTGLSYLSPRDAGGLTVPARPAAAAAPRSSKQLAPPVAYAGGYSVYSPQAAPAATFASTKAPGTAPARMAGRQQQQHQPVVTAVDLARSRSGIRRTSSSSSAGHAHYPAGYSPGYLNSGGRGAQPVAVSGAAASRAAYAQQQYPKQRTYSSYAPVARRGYNEEYQ